MTKVYIKGGCLWFNGQLFKSGDTVEVDDQTAAELAKDKSNQFVIGDSSTASNVVTPPKTTKANKSEGSDDVTTTLPPPDFTGKSK